MKKTIKLNDTQKIELDASSSWLFCYRAQFGRDILPEFMPLLEAVLSIGVGVAPVLSGKNIDGSKIADMLTDGDIIEAASTLSGMETTTIFQIIWAMAKNADDSIPEVEEWLKQFDVFPLDTILPGLIKVAIESSMSSKNSRRLLKKLRLIKAKA